MKTFQVNGDPYIYNLWCVTDCTNKAFYKYITKNWGEPDTVSDEDCKGELKMVNHPKTGEARFFFWLKEIKEDFKSIEIISHELNHLSFDVLKRALVPVSASSNEAFAYYQGTMLYKILCKLYSPNLKKK